MSETSPHDERGSHDYPPENKETEGPQLQTARPSMVGQESATDLPNPAPRASLKTFRVIMILFLPFFLFGCGDVGCDSDDVLQTAKELVIQRIHNSGFDDSFDLMLDNVRPQDSSSQQLLCKANAVVTNSKMLAAMGSSTFTYDVDYRVERTTDGKLYITVYPLHMSGQQ